MASNNTTFTSLTSGTRDSRADKGAVYFLDGNTTNGRLNLSAGTRWQVGDNTRINIQGNPNHSYMRGIIEGEDLTYIMHVESGGRGDFSFNSGGYQVRNMTYIYQGDGDIYNHLESDNNQLTGNTKFIIDMVGGRAFIQTNPKEYADMSINIKPSNLGDLLFYCSRQGNNHVSLPGFKTVGLSSLTLPADGSGANKHGRFYDPEYYDSNNNLLTNNILEIVRTGNGTDSIEYFTFDFTDVHEDTHLYVEDSNSTVLYSNLQLTDANCKIYEQDNTTELTYYAGKKVVPIEVRRIGTTASTTRNLISYKLRRVGYLPTEENLIVLNSPKIFTELQIDSNYANSIIAGSINTAQELYDVIHTEVMNEFSLPVDLLRADGNSLTVPTGWTLVRDQSITNAVEIDISTQEIRVKTGVDGLQKTDKFNALVGTIDASFDGHTDMDFVLVTNQTNFRISNIVNGSSVSIIRNYDGVEIADGVSTGTEIELTESYTAPDYNVTIRIMTDGYKMMETNAIAKEGIVSVISPNLIRSFGQIDTNLRVRNVDTFDIGLTGTKVVDVDTTLKTFSMVDQQPLRNVLSGIMLSWDASELNQIEQPCEVDDVRGLAIYDGWDFTQQSKDERLTDEGFVKRDNNNAVTEFLYNLKIQDNATPVEYQFYHNNIGQGIQTVNNVEGGDSLNTLVSIDSNINDVYITAKIKHPLYLYKTVNETIIESGVIKADRYRLQDTKYLVSLDTQVTEDLRSEYDTLFSYNNTPVNVGDSNSITRIFSNGTLNLKGDTSSVQEVINQLSAITSSEFNFDTKLFTLNNDGSLTIENGYYITISGASLSGSLRGLIKLYDDNGINFATPEFRNITFSLPSTWTGLDFNYVCILNDGNVLTANPQMLLDADNQNIQGTITAGQSISLSIQTSLDTPLRFIYGSADSEISEHVETLTGSGINFEMSVKDEEVLLYRDESLVSDNPINGTKAWYPEIDNITIDIANRIFTIPNPIVTCEINYVYRRWRKWIESDFDNLKYGVVFRGANIAKPSNADGDDNTYLYNPEWQIGYSWRLDVSPTRATNNLVKFTASKQERFDDDQGFGVLHNELIYPTPLANGTTPIEVIVVGATNKTLTEINAKLQDNYNILKTDGVELKESDRNSIEANGIVYINTTLGVNGNGSFKQPFNSLTELNTFLNNNDNIKNVGLLSDIEFNVVFNNIDFIGFGYPNLTTNTVNNFNNCTFKNCQINGDFRNVIVNKSNVLDCNLHNSYNNCSLSGSLTINNTIDVELNRCKSNDVTLDFSNIQDNTIVNLNNVIGDITFVNLTNNTVNINIDTTSCKIILDDSNTDGNINISGNYTIENNMLETTNIVIIEKVTTAKQGDVNTIKEQTDKIQFNNDDEIIVDVANISNVIDGINDLMVADSFNIVSIDNNTSTLTCLGTDLNNQTDNFYTNHVILVRNPLTNELNKRSIVGSLNILGNITFVLNAPLTFEFSDDMVANILVDDISVNNITNAIMGQTNRMTFDQNNRMEVNLDDLQRLFVNDSFTITNISNEVISCEDTDLNVTTDDYYKDFILLVRNPTTNILNKRTITGSLLTGNTVDFTLDSALDFTFENDIIANIMIKDKLTDNNIVDIKTIVDKIQFTDDNDIKATLDGELDNIEDRLNNLPVS